MYGCIDLENEGFSIKKTYCESFEGISSRILVTAPRSNKKTGHKILLYQDPLAFSAWRATSAPSAVIGRLESGIESLGWLSCEKTPDNREGVVLQFWGEYDKSRPVKEQVDKFYKELSYRIRQDILCTPETRVFDWMHPYHESGKIDVEMRIGRCGAGSEYEEKIFGRKMMMIPLMAGYDWAIERELSYRLGGVMGANYWVMAESPATSIEACEFSLESIHELCKGVITPFYSCPSGSSPEHCYPVGPATNLDYCPTIKGRRKSSRVPEAIGSIYEIVINGLSIVDVKSALGNGIDSVAEYSEETGKKILISAGNYGGSLGKGRIFLEDLF